MIRVRQNPAGHLVLVDGRTLVDAGKEGLIRDRDVASAIRDFLQLANPEATVKTYEVYEMTKV